jgi:hypothetical protein
MTDRDESSEGFLERWSRKKIDAEQKAPDASKPEDVVPAGPPQRAAEHGVPAAAADASKPEFDLSSLPSLESITAGTDIRAFLTPGVPAEMARAALRRAWTADAAIRDFVGLAENAWDFTDPAAMPGFGPLEPGYDIKRAVAQMFGEVEKLTGDATATGKPTVAQPNHLLEQKALPEAQAEAERADTGPQPGPSETQTEEPKLPESTVVQCGNIPASHKSISQIAADEPRPRRNHGSALPQ